MENTVDQELVNHMKEFIYRSPLMGTELDVTFIGDLSFKSDFEKLLNLGKFYEKTFSRFDSSSELCQLNFRKKKIVSSLFMEVFLEAKFLYEKTEGIFNPLLSPRQIGYNTDFKTTQQFFKIENKKANIDFSQINSDPKNNIIELQPDQYLDFGGFLKGYLAQKMSEEVPHIPGIIINLGGDIYVSGKDLETPDFNLSIDNPVFSEIHIPISLKNQALATSGSYNRTWSTKHHIMNPKTQDSSYSDLISASVISKNGALADALATVCIIIGANKSQKLLDNLNLDLQYVLIQESGIIIKSLK